MKSRNIFTDDTPKKWGTMITMGIALSLIALLYISYPINSKLQFIILMGTILIINGISLLFYIIINKQLLWSLIISIVFIITGLYSIYLPSFDLMTIAIFVTFSVFVEAITRILSTYHWYKKESTSILITISGILTIIIGSYVLYFIKTPNQENSIYFIVIFFSASSFIEGVSLILLGLKVKNRHQLGIIH